MNTDPERVISDGEIIYGYSATKKEKKKIDKLFLMVIDQRPLTGDTLKELGFIWSKAEQAYVMIHPSFIQLKFVFELKSYYFDYNDDRTYFKTVGSVKMLIEALKGDE